MFHIALLHFLSFSFSNIKKKDRLQWFKAKTDSCATVGW